MASNSLKQRLQNGDSLLSANNGALPTAALRAGSKTPPINNSFSKGQYLNYIADIPSAEAELGQRVQRAILTNQASIEGFLVFRFEQRYNIAIKRMSKWLQEGKIIWKEDIVEGIENAPKAFIGLMKGENFGKLLIKVKL